MKNIILCIIGAVGIAALVLIIINMRNLSTQSDTLSAFIDREDERYAEAQKKENEFIEDGAIVGEIYEIKSTKAVSDAYVNGQDPSGLSEEDKKTYEIAVKCFEEATRGKDTIYDKELGIYEWMCKNIEHSGDASTRAVLSGENYPMDTPYGVLNSKTAVCVGYATTFRLFMNMLGLECHIPHTDSHSWDLVKLDDDQWYYVDIYFSVNSSSKNPDYTYFNMNEIVASEQGSTVAALPKANGRKYQYATMKAEDAKDTYKIPKRYKKAVDDKDYFFSLRFKEDPSEDEVKMCTFLTEAVNNRLRETEPEKYSEIYSNGKWYRDENDKFVFAVYINDNSDSSELDTKSEEVKKMRKLLDRIFGTTTGYDPFSSDEDMEGMTDGEYTFPDEAA